LAYIFPEKLPLFNDLIPWEFYLYTPWSGLSEEANRFSTIKEIPRILWNPKVC